MEEYIKSCIYAIKYEGRIVYIGRHNTPNYIERWKQHVYAHRMNKQTLLHKNMNEKGIDNFTVEKICECDAKDVGDIEIKYIKEYNTLMPHGYNMRKGGDCRKPYEKVLLKCTYAGCNYITIFRDKFEIHTRVHTGEKPLKCDFSGCTFATNSSSSLKTHKYTHTGKRNYHCIFNGCNYNAITNAHLTLHNMIHLGEKPYMCDISGCNYSTVKKFTLKEHKRTHTGEKPYKCDISGCNYSSARSGDLKYHMNSSRHK